MDSEMEVNIVSAEGQPGPSRRGQAELYINSCIISGSFLGLHKECNF